VITAAGMDLRLSSELKEIVDDGQGRACAVVAGDGERIEAQLVGLTAGVSPNLDLVRETAIECDRGILVDRSLRTSAADVFAAGDCAEIRRDGEERNLLQQVWYTGKQQGRVAAEAMAVDATSGDAPTYEPGHWYNSAKFLDLEYQTYGEVLPSGRGQHSLWWEHPSGLKGMRVAVEGAGGRGDRVAGINVMGLRYRHEVCRDWLARDRSLDYVLDHLGEANFDPEFEPRFESEVAASMRGGKS